MPFRLIFFILFLHPVALFYPGSPGYLLQREGLCAGFTQYDSIGNAPAAPPATGRICPHRKSVTGQGSCWILTDPEGGTQKMSPKSIKKSPAYWRDFLSLCWHYLSSRQVTLQVLSAQMSLTSVFGMGTGGPSSQSIPTISDGCYPSLSMSKPSFRF